MLIVLMTYFIKSAIDLNRHLFACLFSTFFLNIPVNNFSTCLDSVPGLNGTKSQKNLAQGHNTVTLPVALETPTSLNTQPTKPLHTDALTGAPGHDNGKHARTSKNGRTDVPRLLQISGDARWQNVMYYFC